MKVEQAPPEADPPQTPNPAQTISPPPPLLTRTSAVHQKHVPPGRLRRQAAASLARTEQAAQQVGADDLWGLGLAEGGVLGS
jgi:hypothetical protein